MKDPIISRKMRFSSWSVPVILVVLVVSCTTPSIIATREQQQGDYYNNLNQYREAILHYEKYLEASKQLGVYRNLDMEADVCRKVANAYSTQGDFSKAISYVSKALVFDSIQNNPLEIIEDYRTLGKIHLYTGNYSQGIEFLEKALELNDGMESSLKAVNRLSIADTYISLGQAYNALGQFDQTEQYIKQALSIYEELKNKQGLMEAYLLLANRFILTGETNQANIHLQQSLEIARDLDLNRARQLQTIGELYETEGEYEKALNAKLEALSEAKEANITPLILWSQIGVGDTYSKIGDFEKAYEYFDLSTQLIQEETLQSKSLGASLNMRLGNVQSAQQFFAGADAFVAAGLASLRLGEAKYQLGEVFSSLASYQQAIDYFQKSEIREGMAKAYLRIGHIQVDENDLAKARSNLLQAAELTIQQETKWQISYHMGRLYEIQEQPDSAMKAYQEAIQIIEEIRGKFTVDEFKSIYIDDKIDVYDRLINLMLNIDREEEAFAYAQRARSRAFLDIIGNKKIDSKSSANPELVEREQELRFEIQQLTRALMRDDLKTTGGEVLRGEARGQLESNLLETRNQYSTLLNQLKMNNKAYQSMVVVEPVTLKATQALLDEKTALIEYWAGEDKLITWIITKDNFITVESNISAARIQQLVMICRQLMQRGLDIAYTPRLKELYEILILPIEKWIENHENLGFIPHGALHFFPFQALLDPQNVYLIEKFYLFYTPSVSVYEQCINTPVGNDNQLLAMALGNMSIGKHSGLPGTLQEVQNISKKFPEGITKYENESTESFLKENSASYKYIHLATHGVLNPVQPMYSYILFNPTEVDDGQLAVHEVFGLDLNARLVTLSACQTGLGDISKGDELIGLSRAFLYAGSSAVIVTLCQVADEPTALLMSRFYEHMKTASPHKALSLAQREVMKQYENPYHWAPFKLIGYGGN
jgi:CHAT domain-containing protein